MNNLKFGILCGLLLLNLKISVINLIDKIDKLE